MRLLFHLVRPFDSRSGAQKSLHGHSYRYDMFLHRHSNPPFDQYPHKSACSSWNSIPLQYLLRSCLGRWPLPLLRWNRTPTFAGPGQRYCWCHKLDILLHSRQDNPVPICQHWVRGLLMDKLWLADFACGFVSSMRVYAIHLAYPSCDHFTLDELDREGSVFSQVSKRRDDPKSQHSSCLGPYCRVATRQGQA